MIISSIVTVCVCVRSCFRVLTQVGYFCILIRLFVNYSFFFC